MNSATFDESSSSAQPAPSGSTGPTGLVILGSTGSIGESTLSVVSNLGPSQVRVIGLAGGSRWEKLAAQALELKPLYLSVAEGEPFKKLKDALAGKPIKVLCGSDGQREMVAAAECQTVLAAVTGAAGLPAVLETAARGKRLCLSNKESLVVAGPLVRKLARENKAELLPVDSEHSALFQALIAGSREAVKRLILTASGGPFREWSAERIKSATVDQALQHPTWKMGPNITIDSATLMNKALELIEALFLFDVRPDQLDVIVHPQSVIHSLVEYVDGNVIAQLGVPDMRVPIQYALTWPQRAPLPTAPFDLAKISKLSFEDVDHDRFPAIRLAYEVMRRGGAAGAIFNAANETARAAFLAGKIRFPAIVATVAQVLENASEAPGHGDPAPPLETLLAADNWARKDASRCLETLS